MKDKVVMSIADFLAEHNKLIRILKKGDKKELLKEAKEQQEELDEETK